MPPARFFLLLLSLAVAAFAAPGDPITYSMSLTSGPAYNATANTTSFTYSITSNPAGGPAISHVVLGLSGSCAGASAIVGASDPLTSWVNPDPTTGLTGVKFDTGYNDRETRSVTLTLAGSWTTGSIPVAIKSGNGFVLSTVTGPVCGAVTPPATYTIGGTVFFDSNYNGSYDADEAPLGGFTVTLTTAAGTPVATTTTSANGLYTFSGLPAASYVVTVTNAIPALSPTTLVEHDVTVGPDATAPVTGFAIKFPALSGLTANGFTIGYWKNNLAKAAAGTTKGVQVSATTLAGYTATLGNLALSPFAGLTTAAAIDTLSSTGSAPASLLAKQLLASEYNYASGGYLGGSERLTYLFIYQGEYVLKNAANYDAAYLLWLKDWFDAYNNTHGGALVAPTL